MYIHCIDCRNYYVAELRKSNSILSEHNREDSFVFVAANEADGAVVQAHDLAGETQTDT